MAGEDGGDGGDGRDCAHGRGAASDSAALEELTRLLRSRANADGDGSGGGDEGDAQPWGERGEVRARGAFFTPRPLVRFVVEETLRPLADVAPRRLTVLDPACGDGRFLAVAAEWAARHLPGTELALIGIERDPRTAEVARQRLQIQRLQMRRPTEVGSRSGAAEGSVEIREGEALLGEDLAAPVDAVVGNPPYIRSIHLRARDPALWAALRQRFAATSHGEWDLYAPFIERTLTWLREGGRAGLVVPSRWLTAAFAAQLRRVMAPAVERVVDFGALQLFPGATTYASVAVLERGRTARTAVLARRATGGWVGREVELTALDGAPWILRAGPAHRQLDAAHGTLGEVAQIAKGCGTNADRVFVVRGVQRGEWLEGVNGNGAAVRVEARLVRRCLRGRDVEREGAGERGTSLASTTTTTSTSTPTPTFGVEVGMLVAESESGSGATSDYCLLPYRGLDEPGPVPPQLIPWPELLAEAPGVAAYFEAHRAALECREQGRFAGPAFYQLGRPQNLRFLLDPRPKVVIPDVAARGRAVIDRGSLVLDSAYAVRPRPEALAPWQSPALLLVLLRSPAVRLWLDMVGVPLRGHYFRMKTAFLAPMPLPPDGDALRLCAAAAEAGDLVTADELLRQAYAIELAAWESAR